MKSLLFIVLLFTCASFPQSFTRILTGVIATDSGASRSVNWINSNNDDYPDLFVSHGFYSSAQPGENNALYINSGPPSFTFSKNDTSIINNDARPSDGSSWGDFNNDGYLDAFVVNWYNFNNLMYQNNSAGNLIQLNSIIPVNDHGNSETCTWGDYDNDGFIDLYVTNSGNSGAPEKNFLYHNKTDGTFEKITQGEIVNDAFFSRGANWIDYDNDGDVDMFVANERNQPDNLYKNMLTETGTASFTKVTGLNIVTESGSSWSGSWGDFNNDLLPDLFVACNSQGGQNNKLYKNNGDGTFTKILNEPLVQDLSSSACAGWGDYDNDGDLDLIVTNAYGASDSKNLLYKNQLTESGNASFEQITTGELVTITGYSYGAAWGDYDLDGDLDLFFARTTNEKDLNLLFRNDNNNGNHWLEINCKGFLSNTSAIGTKVKIKARINNQDIWQIRTVEGQSGYCAQNLTLHFGLGNATVIDTIIFDWPSGIEQIMTNVNSDQLIKAEEDISLGVNDNIIIPGNNYLKENYPNPFNPSTKIKYGLKEAGKVNISVYDLLGNKITELVNENKPVGDYEVDFISDGGLASGIYLYRMIAGRQTQTKKMVLLR